MGAYIEYLVGKVWKKMSCEDWIASKKRIDQYAIGIGQINGQQAHLGVPDLRSEKRNPRAPAIHWNERPPTSVPGPQLRNSQPDRPHVGGKKGTKVEAELF